MTTIVVDTWKITPETVLEIDGEKVIAGKERPVEYYKGRCFKVWTPWSEKHAGYYAVTEILETRQ